MLSVPWILKPLREEPEAALLVLVSEAESLLDEYREHFPRSDDLALPAHITINYPFRDGLRLQEDESLRLEELVGAVPPIDFALRNVGRFEDVVYLVPTPAAPFQRLSRQIAQAFPHSPPYEGEFQKIIPHLTIVQLPDRDELLKIETDLRQRLQRRGPLEARAESE
jgi:2'-5' RNA ligase